MNPARRCAVAMGGEEPTPRRQVRGPRREPEDASSLSTSEELARKQGWLVGSVLEVCGSSAQGEGPARKVGPRAIRSSNEHIGQGVDCAPHAWALVSSSIPWRRGLEDFQGHLLVLTTGEFLLSLRGNPPPGLLPEQRALCALCLAWVTPGPCVSSAWHGQPQALARLRMWGCWPSGNGGGGVGGWEGGGRASSVLHSPLPPPPGSAPSSPPHPTLWLDSGCQGGRLRQEGQEQPW